MREFETIQAIRHSTGVISLIAIANDGTAWIGERGIRVDDKIHWEQIDLLPQEGFKDIYQQHDYQYVIGHPDFESGKMLFWNDGDDDDDLDAGWYPEHMAEPQTYNQIGIAETVVDAISGNRVPIIIAVPNDEENEDE